MKSTVRKATALYNVEKLSGQSACLAYQRTWLNSLHLPNLNSEWHIGLLSLQKVQELDVGALVEWVDSHTGIFLTHQRTWVVE